MPVYREFAAMQPLSQTITLTAKKMIEVGALNLSILSRIRTNIADVYHFGPLFLKRHLPRLTGAPLARVHIPEFGPIYLRAGESDVAAVRQTYRDNQYYVGIDALRKRIGGRYSEIVRSGSTPIIVDAGANIGAAALWFAKEYPAAHVIAVEPEPGNFSVLRRNVEREPRIVAVPAAVGSTKGFVSVQNETLGWASRTIRSETGVAMITMHDAFATVANGTPFLAKIDIEGFESDLFATNTDWLESVYLVFIEPHDWMLPGKMTSQSFQRMMAKHDFEIFICGENLLYVRT
jgi:FkbM family methyltransferase